MKPKAAIYLRLSRDDGTHQESNSITNQRDMLLRKAAELNIDVYREYLDDGHTGTNFNRPGFKQMIEDIEANLIGVVMVKDLSRLGRNNALTSFYIELFFPEHYIRFISMVDNIDSIKGEDDILPFKNIMNEFYARDLSKKVRSVKKNSSYKGEYMGSFAPYGYKRDEKKMVIDDDTAPIVKYIFEMIAKGQSMYSVARQFTVWQGN